MNQLLCSSGVSCTLLPASLSWSSITSGRFFGCNCSVLAEHLFFSPKLCLLLHSSTITTSCRCRFYSIFLEAQVEEGSKGLKRCAPPVAHILDHCHQKTRLLMKRIVKTFKKRTKMVVLPQKVLGALGIPRFCVRDDSGTTLLFL